MKSSSELTNRAVGATGAGDVELEAKGKPVNLEANPKAALELRIARARALPTPPMLPTLHCPHCFGEGRDAAIRAFEAPLDSV